VKLVKALRESQRSWEEIQELLGISRATYYRWERALREKGLAGLKPKSRRPKRTRGKVHWKPELMVRVEVLRKENPPGGDGPSGRFSGRRVFLWGNGRWATF
jgi:transposase